LTKNFRLVPAAKLYPEPPDFGPENFILDADRFRLNGAASRQNHEYPRSENWQSGENILSKFFQKH
jgi:hypothetical protein